MKCPLHVVWHPQEVMDPKREFCAPSSRTHLEREKAKVGATLTLFSPYVFTPIDVGIMWIRYYRTNLFCTRLLLLSLLLLIVASISVILISSLDWEIRPDQHGSDTDLVTGHLSRSGVTSLSLGATAGAVASLRLGSRTPVLFVWATGAVNDPIARMPVFFVMQLPY